MEAFKEFFPLVNEASFFSSSEAKTLENKEELTLFSPSNERTNLIGSLAENDVFGEIKVLLSLETEAKDAFLTEGEFLFCVKRKMKKVSEKMIKIESRG